MRGRERAIVAALAAAAWLAGYLAAAPSAALPALPAFPGPLEVLAPAGVLLGLSLLGLSVVLRRRR